MRRRSRSADEPIIPAVPRELRAVSVPTPDINQEVVRLFALVGEAIASATHALLTSDRDLAKKIVLADEEIDRIATELTRYAEQVLVDPTGADGDERRSLVTLLRVLPEIERNGDLAEHIARRGARGLGNEMSSRSRGLIERMGEVASQIWRDATDVIVDDQAESLEYLEDVDDELDELHVALSAELTSGSMPVPVAVEVALVARFFERFGDHAVNMARRQVGHDLAD
jgi:phosphate transport system protein